MTSSTASALIEAVHHLKAADPVLAGVIERVGECQLTVRNTGTHFDAIVRAIVYQQLSGKAAATIHRRLEALYGGPPLPAQLAASEEAQLRSVGLSRQKLSYLKHFAALVESEQLSIEALDGLEDQAIIEALTQVRGIGRWTAQMFLLFRLGRLNVLPEADLGVQKGIQLAYGLEKLPTPKQVIAIAEPWHPFCSVASWYFWRSLD
ncbi:DNA-3-methyladenine glycosylase family protein [Gloeobacter kilaueensis]|uniref:DNA-3-methyladenine glycosylase II n=1 Tax=Gloeobacter kilaueensis (strain ATCC BAA-2537 / CCAP 1431/1 / ULC 316 / JS1) TaxID=1183438 RepID=U5QFL9_GLOK1|nr:DNA-3-methyladenine glycosylase [Gloeobacter kilaueensis]AGY56470.1 DNA-3-methyladenine glycosylase II [Gloeobacter kilaueensis JS1]